MFEDNAWDEFDENDDLIVPHSGNKHKNQFVIQGDDDCKKLLHELHDIRSSDYVSGCGTLGKEELYLQNMTQRGRMPEKDSWYHTPESIFSLCDSDSYKDERRLTSDDTGMSDHCFKSSNLDSGTTILEGKCAVEDESMCQYPINHASQADNELSFLDNDGWLDIGNFEDVDRMLSFDLTYGIGSLNNEEEFGWLSSPPGAEGSNDALKTDLKFSCEEMSSLKNISDYNMDSKENTECVPMNDSNKKSSLGDKEKRSQMDVDNNSDPASLSMISESDMKSVNKDGLVPKEKQKLPKPSAARRKIGYLEDGNSIHPSPEQYAAINQSFGASSSGVTSFDSIQKHKMNTGFGSSGCIQSQIPTSHPDFSHAPNYTSLFPTLSGLRSEHSRNQSPSLKESSYASNMESSHVHCLQPAALKTNEKREKLYYSQDRRLLSRSFKNEKMANEMPFYSPRSSQQVALPFENEGHSEVRGVSNGFSSEIDSSTVQESSSMSSVLDQTSLEATSFCHLRLVLDQLDVRTKLCIRDSLYRLAKSSEQRHDSSSPNGCIGDDEACKATVAQDASRFTGLMDLETNTNPIDRSIAHLLFHRPSDTSLPLPNDTAPFKSSTMIDESVINQLAKAEKQVCQKDSSTRVERAQERIAHATKYTQKFVVRSLAM